MVVQGVVDDLKSAQASGLCVNLTLSSGTKLWSSAVQELREEDGVVVFFAPQRFGDEATTRTVDIADVADVVVTTLPYKGHSKD